MYDSLPLYILRSTHSAYSVSGGGESESIVWDGSGSRGRVWGGVKANYVLKTLERLMAYKYIHRNEL